MNGERDNPTGVRRTILMLLLSSALALARVAYCVEEGAQDPLRQWRPSDSPLVRYVIDSRHGEDWDLGKSLAGRWNPVVPSADGQFFFFVTQQGDFHCDCNVYELRVYRTSDVVAALKSKNWRSGMDFSPIRTVTMSHKQQAIAGAEWVGGEDSVIEFRGLTPTSIPVGNDPAQASLYWFHVGSGKLETVIDVPRTQRLSDYQRQARGVVYTLRESRLASVNHYPIYAPTRERMGDLLMGGGRTYTYDAQSYASWDGRQPWRLKSGYVLTDFPWLSPNGKLAVATRRPLQVYPSWSEYDGRINKAATVSAEEFTQFVLIDLEHETEVAMLEAPQGQFTRVGASSIDVNYYLHPQAFWSDDSRHVLLTNTALPLDGADPVRQSTPYIVSYEISTRRWDVLEPYRSSNGDAVTTVSWLEWGRRILVEHTRGGKPLPATVYTHEASGWKPRNVAARSTPVDLGRQISNWKPFKAAPSLPNGLLVQERESANEPPRVIASLGRRELSLMNPDPALENIQLTSKESLQWNDNGGVVRFSGILLPRTLPKGTGKIPLVIQAGAYQPALFRPDGPSRTAYAAQSLAARNMAVLELDIPTLLPGVGGTPQEAAMFIDWTEAAAAAAAKKYPIDLDRVGLLGFSRTGFLTRYLITNPRRLVPAAAVIADSFTGSFALMMLDYATSPNPVSAWDPFYGGTFYQAKKSWYERELAFNIDRVRTPVLFADNADTLVNVVDTIGGFRAAHKPFEYLLLPDGTHQLLTPRQREASIEASVDWMAFWLLGEEDSRSDKAERFSRWRELRKMHEENLQRTKR